MAPRKEMSNFVDYAGWLQPEFHKNRPMRLAMLCITTLCLNSFKHAAQAISETRRRIKPSRWTCFAADVDLRQKMFV